VLLATFASSALWFLPILFLQGAVAAATVISGVAILFEFTSAENRPTYIALGNMAPSMGGVIAPLIGGWLAETAGYRTMFVVSAVIGALGWALLRFAVREPRKGNLAASVKFEGGRNPSG